jgi:hypothetical protein
VASLSIDLSRTLALPFADVASSGGRAGGAADADRAGDDAGLADADADGTAGLADGDAVRAEARPPIAAAAEALGRTLLRDAERDDFGPAAWTAGATFCGMTTGSKSRMYACRWRDATRSPWHLVADASLDQTV